MTRSPLDVVGQALVLCSLVVTWFAVTVSVIRPLGCSAGTTSAGATWQHCEYFSSSAVGLVVAAAMYVLPIPLVIVGFRGSRRWLLIIGTPLLVISLASFIGALTLAPAALWFAAGFWPNSRTRVAFAILQIAVVLIAIGLAGLGVEMLVGLAPGSEALW